MKTKLFPYICFVLAGLLMVLSPGSARAQDDDQGQAPPGRVATLDYMQGSVSYEPAGEQNWVDAETNRPLTTGDNLWSDQSSRAELFIGSTALRMGDSTGISFLNLTDNVAQVQLAEGTLEIDVRYLDPNESYEIDTPNLAFSILRPGDYILSADPNGGQTSVSVYSGQGSVTGGGQTFNVTPGQDAVFAGTNQLSENVQGLGNDDFDGWARSREMREEHSESARYVSRGVTGYEDLDEYGSWHSDPDYGNYWVPRDVDSGWAPYHEGHWAWVAPWGWTWVDDEPWGFAPFHYGRWAMINGGWGWVPGPVAVAPVYAPALVGFVGGGGFGVAVSFGSMEGVGWYPLGPRDVYVPPYQVDPMYVQRINEGDTRYVNQTQVTTIYNNYTVNHVTYNNYTYANNTNAVTVVNRNTFVSGERVQRGAIRVNQEQIAHPQVVTTAALTPTRTSVVGAAARPAPRAPAERPAAARVVTKLPPSPRAEPIGRPRPATNPNLRTAVLQRSGYSPQMQLVHAKAAAAAPARAATPAPGNTTRPGAPAARPEPTPARPGAPAARPGAPVARPAPGQPARPAPGEPARPAPNNARPTRPFTPPNRPATRPETQPARPGTPERPAPVRPAQPSNPERPGTARPNFPPARPAPNNARPTHPFTPPNRPTVTPETRPPVRENRPATQPRPEARPTPPAERPQPRPREAPPVTRMPNRPAAQPRPEARPPARPTPQPRPETRPPEQRPQARPQPQRPQPERKPPPKKKPGGTGGDGSGGL